jgi:hypothetical protein
MNNHYCLQDSSEETQPHFFSSPNLGTGSVTENFSRNLTETPFLSVSEVRSLPAEIFDVGDDLENLNDMPSGGPVYDVSDDSSMSLQR